MSDGEALTGFGGVEPDLSDLEQIGREGSAAGFIEELGDFDVPAEGDGGDGAGSGSRTGSGSEE